jgi:hypothetical protein
MPGPPSATCFSPNAVCNEAPQIDNSPAMEVFQQGLAVQPADMTAFPRRRVRFSIFWRFGPSRFEILRGPAF